MTGPIPERWAPYLQSVLRIVVAFLFVAHGTQKFMGFPSAEATAGVPLMSLRGVASVIEMVGGTLLLFGLFTRPIAFILAGEMAVAYFMVHAPGGFWPLQNKGELAVIGRGDAVANLPGLRFGGFIAWCIWIFLHIAYLIGFRNRVLVLIQWAWSYITYARGARLITGEVGHGGVGHGGAVQDAAAA